MNVLSLFDGMSCGQIALNRLGIHYDNYFASEIDTYAIKITQKNYPETIQLGDVTKVSSKNLPKIDLLIGGPPCQGFSFAGKGLNFEDPRSKLFFEYVRLLKECKPKYFLLENVKMKKEFEDIITKYLGVGCVKINSNLVSAQNRFRLYWTNIPREIGYVIGDFKDQPEDKGIILKDILENGVVDRDKSHCIDASYYKGGNWGYYMKKSRRQMVFPDEAALEKAKSLYHPNFTRKEIDQVSVRLLTPLECERLQTVPEGYTDGVSNTQRYKMLGNGWTIDIITHILKGMDI